MKANLCRAAALITLLGLLIASVLPPEHLHQSAAGVGRVHRHIHRHLSAHTSPVGTHVERPCVPEGAPHWLDDPGGAMSRPPVVAADTTVVQFRLVRPVPGDVAHVTPRSDVPVHPPPRSPAGLRGPPAQT
jgi:hypothetical protein